MGRTGTSFRAEPRPSPGGDSAGQWRGAWAPFSPNRGSVLQVQEGPSFSLGQPGHSRPAVGQGHKCVPKTDYGEKGLPKWAMEHRHLGVSL